MEAKQTYTDLNTLLVIVLGLVPESDERSKIAEQIASRHGMVELLHDRVGVYEGGDG